MRKGIKILGKVSAAAVLLLIILPVAVALLLDIPAVQNFVVHKAAAIVSRKLETTVRIGRVDIGLFSKLQAEDFYVEDYQHDTLIYARRLEAYVTRFGFSGGGLVLGSARLQDAKLCLRETPDGEMNIKQVIDHLSRKDKPKKGNFRLTISSVRIDGMEFCLERRNRKNPPYGIDFGHLHLYDMQASVDELTIDGSAIHTSIRSLAARERSGFVLDDLSGRFYLNSGCIGFEDLALRTARSTVDIPYISLVGNSWPDYKDFLGEVEISASLRHSTLATDDVAYFAPKLRDWHLVFSGIDCGVEGSVSDFTATVQRLRAGPDTELSLNAVVRGLPDIRNAYFNLDIRRLTTSAADAGRLAEAITRKALPEKVLRIADRAGEVALKGRFTGTFATFRMQAALETAVGQVDCNLQVQPQDGRMRRVLGDVALRRIGLGQLLGTEKLGAASLTAYVDGTLGKDDVRAKVEARVSEFGFNGYVYDSIRLDGRVDKRRFDGVVVSRDPNLDFAFGGMVDLNDSVPRYDFGLDLRRADLVRLHFNPRDSVSVLSARVAARAAGRSLDDLNGQIRIFDASYRYNDRTLTAQEVTVRGENSARSKYVALRSDFADVTFRSKTSYREVIEYLKMSAWKYLPILYDRDKYVQRAQTPTAVANDYSLLSVEIKRINPLVDAFSRGLQIADGSRLQLLFNPASDQLSLKVSSEYVERDRLLATHISVNAANRGDSLAFYAASEDFYLGMLHLRELSLAGGAREGRLQLSTGFNDTLNRVSGLFGLTARLAPEPGPDGPVLDVRILPSHLRRDNTTWQIFARRIQLDTARVVVDHFTVRNDQQELLINGTASRHRQDSVSVRLRNFDLAPFTQVLESTGYRIEGVTNGTATLRSAMRVSEVAADIRFDSLAVNGLAAPPLQLVSKWDFQRNRAGVVLRNPMRRDTLVRGFFVPSEGRYYAQAKVDSLELGLLDPVLKGVIGGTEGYASGRIEIRGKGRDVTLGGGIRVRGLSTTVDFTQVTYSVPEARLEVENNHLRARGVPIFDPEHNEGTLDVDLNFAQLSNIAYTVRVAPQGMMVLNTTSRDNDVFYGRVYATGAATIAGDKRGVNMDIAATTDDNSSFNLPLSGKTDIANADFVVFASPEKTDTVDLLARKKQLFEKHRTARKTGAAAMNISLALNVQPNLDFQLETSGNVIRGRGQGMLNLTIKPRQGVFQMYGDYTITEGTVVLSLLNVVSRKFSIEDGSTIQWTGGPLDALLDISAIYSLKASLAPLLQGTTESNVGGDRLVPVECVIHLGDRLAHPAVTFDVRVPSGDPETQTVVANALSSSETIASQFLSLLVTGSFMSDTNRFMSGFGGWSGVGGQGISMLTGLLSKWFSTDDYSVLIRYRPKSEMTNEELDFGLSKSLINNRLIVEVEGNYILDDTQAVNENISNFMGEAYVTWLIDRAGTLRLRGFTQTIDQFDENQGLQETGIGIYYKEDFNNLKDLWQRIKDHFISKKRREARRREALERMRRGTDAERRDASVPATLSAATLSADTLSADTTASEVLPTGFPAETPADTPGAKPAVSAPEAGADPASGAAPAGTVASASSFVGEDALGGTPSLIPAEAVRTGDAWMAWDEVMKYEELK